MLTRRASGARRRVVVAAAGVALAASSAASGATPAPRGELVFAVARAADLGTARVDARGTGRGPVALPEPTVVQRPAFSPDGRRVVYVCGNFELCVAGADGGRRARLTRAKPWTYDGAPAWRPDGRRLAFSSNRGGRYRIFVVGADGRGLRAITHGPGADANPAWSPDGRRIAYDSKVGATTRLYVVAADGGRRRALGPRTGGAASPAWSPDGKWIAFTHGVRGGSHIELVRTDGKTRRVLTRGRSRDDHAAWSPDGRWLAFDTNRGGALHVWRVPAAGGRPVAVTTGGSLDLFPVWRPRARRAAAIGWPGAPAPTAASGDARVVAAFVRRLLPIGTSFSRIGTNAPAAAQGIEREARAAEDELRALPVSTPRGTRFKQAALQAVATARTTGTELTLGIQAYTQGDRSAGTQHFQRAFRLSRAFATQVGRAQRVAGVLS